MTETSWLLLAILFALMGQGAAEEPWFFGNSKPSRPRRWWEIWRHEAFWVTVIALALIPIIAVVFPPAVHH
jgi:hypothetical protein